MIRKAVTNNNHNVLAKLLNDDSIRCTINDQDMSGRSALYIAVERNNFECLLLLLQYGADVTSRTTKGSTTLICAASKNHIRCLT